MNVQKETILLPTQPHTLGWLGNQLVCHENGEQYYPEYDAYPAWREMPKMMGYSFGAQFDRVITSKNGQYTLLYTNLGTKGLLLSKPNEVLREVNRSYYCADVYEYPAIFCETGGRTFLVHCPLKYCRLDFEDVETGEILTNTPNRNPRDFFHSRLEISPDGRFLISKGWVWHPLDVIAFYKIEDCLKNPLLLDETTNIAIDAKEENEEEEFGSNFEFCSASFANNELLLTVPTNANTMLYWWDMNKNKMVHNVETGQQLGNLLAVDQNWAWDLFEYPKLINLVTGKIEWLDQSINSGKQNSAIIGTQGLPPIAWNRNTGKLAIGGENKVEVLSLSSH
jgi:hypothetical protein